MQEEDAIERSMVDAAAALDLAKDEHWEAQRRARQAEERRYVEHFAQQQHLLRMQAALDEAADSARFGVCKSTAYTKNFKVTECKKCRIETHMKQQQALINAAAAKDAARKEKADR